MRNKNLTGTQIECIKSLSKGRTRYEAALDAGCNERTVYKWLKKDYFSQAVNEARQACWTALLAGLGHAALGSARYLYDVVEGVQKGEGPKVKAASTLLNAAFNLTRWQEVDSIKARLADLEGGRDDLSNPNQKD